MSKNPCEENNKCEKAPKIRAKKITDVGNSASNSWQTCDFCGIKHPDITNEVFVSDKEVVRHYEVCPVCLVEAFRRMVEMFMDEDEYKVNSIINEVLDEMYCDVVHMNKTSEIEFSEENSNIYELKRK